MIVDVDVIVDVIAHVIVAALVNGNDTVGVTEAVDDQGSMSLVSVAIDRISSRNSMPNA